MKKVKLALVSILSVSFLIGCAGSDPEIVYHTVKFDTDGGSTVESQQVEDGKTATKPNPNPTKEGYTFLDWFTESKHKTIYTFAEPVTRDITLYANWQKIPTDHHLITINAGDGSFTGDKKEVTITVNHGDKLLPSISDITKPALTDSTFAYYEYKGERVLPIGYDDVVTDDVTLEAKYFTNEDISKLKLDNLDWKTIINIVVTGDSTVWKNNWFKIGDTKRFTLYQDGVQQPFQHQVRIIDFDHDVLSGSTSNNPQYANITFEFANVITIAKAAWKIDPFTTKWNGKTIEQESPKNYDYRNATVNKFLNGVNGDITGSILEMMPVGLRKSILTVEKKVGVSTSEGESYTATSFDTKLFLLAHSEYTSDELPEYVVPGEDGENGKYKYYEQHAEAADRIKKAANPASTSGSAYWMRSPHVAGEYDRSCAVDNNGHFKGEGFDVNRTLLPVAPAFCL